MQTEIVISGFGGQGALFAGQLLAYAALDSGRQVTWIPSYGPEMRGGTAHCTVIISDEEIGSPLVRNPAAVVAMNRPSFDKYEALVAPGGVLIINSALVAQPSLRLDIRSYAVPANTIAEALGSAKLANIVLVGALLAATGVLPAAAVKRALVEHLPERHRQLLAANCEALRRGAAAIEALPAAVG
jgi:2-oxoglutarate ferredoxin oxidoreductase subunit gamma